MANTVKVKRSNTALAIPSLVFGEIGYNSADSKLFIGNASNANFQIGSVTSVSVVTANGVSASIATATSTPAITVSLGAITPSSVTVSGVITCSAGTAALPSITKSGDTNTGIFFPAADTVGVSTNATEKLRIDSAGNVSLGVRLSGGIAPNTFHLGTQAGTGLSIYHAAKGGGALDLYQPRRHLSAYVFNTLDSNYGIMRIRIPTDSGGGYRFTIKHTGINSPTFSRSWEINCADYRGGNYTFGTNSLSVQGSPEFARIRLMENLSETIYNSLATRYLILGEAIVGAGTVTNLASSTTVTGTGTRFSSLLKVNDGILINGLWSLVSAIASDTSLTVTPAIASANTAVAYSRGDGFHGSQVTIDVDELHASSSVQINTSFEIDWANSDTGLTLASGQSRDITLSNTNSQQGLFGIGTQSPTSLIHASRQITGVGTVSNSAAGTVITGLNTRFLDTFRVGESITVPHIAGSGTPQTVVISAIASNTSMTVAAVTNANSGASYSMAAATPFTVSAGGNVTTGLGQLSVTGGQIVFPAAANVSTNANTLDDYEEGTWTPVTTASVPGATPPTFSAVSGTYTKTGRVVTVLWTITTNVLGTGSGVLLCAGLPFAADVVSSGSGVQITTTRVSQTVHVAAAATSATITKYDGTYPLFAASVHIFSMTYTTTS